VVRSRRALRTAIAFFLGLFFTCRCGSAEAQTFYDLLPQYEPSSLRSHAVHIIHNPPQDWTGYGIYLGRGLVLTAAHVVGRATRTKPVVEIGGLELASQAVKEGSPDGIDLTLLSIDQEKLPISMRLRQIPLCDGAPLVGEPVYVVIPEGVARSHIMSPLLLPGDYKTKFPTVIRDVATTGNSGSGVFKATRQCLLGIMSSKIQVVMNGPHQERETRDIAKYFVPSATIRSFIPAQYRY
jgi:hypothetical protein